ncbi:MAG TPA: hypothetical protein VNV82_04670 [Bryobacteraceae bacterium]|jgi:hypothetical protein|nr:hypothetical protein [Bryobacteraceae bacterium]
MWTISALHDFPSLRGGGGQPFTGFVDALLRTQCFVYGVPDSAIATTLRVNVEDGGVDTRIDEGAPHDSTGRLRCPSAWQYKAEDKDRVTEGAVAKEVQKHYATELIRRGYGYRICVCDEMPAERKELLEKALNAAAQAIHANAQRCYVLSASDLAEWANRFPGLVATQFNRPMTIARHWQAWQTSERALTPTYVLPPGWQDRLGAIQNHLRFTTIPFDPVLPVQGAAGVGKTRLVFEAIGQIPGAGELVVLSDDDERAVQAAMWLVNSGHLSAILVADECSAQGRFEVTKIVRGHELRIRVIAIDNTGEPPLQGVPGIWLEKIDVSVAEKILAQNYTTVPAERRRAYADLSGGYIRLAADLCRYDPQMSEADGFGPAIPTLQDYYHRRIPPNDQRIVEAIALVHRIGHSADAADQLDLLSSLTGIDPTGARETARRLKDTPGFVAVTPRYFYITPQIIAEIAFQRAWRHWVLPNPTGFLDRIPDRLRPSFELRVRGLSDPEVRSTVSAHFRQRVAGLRTADLAHYDQVKQLLDLVETEPSTHLAQLTRLIREASPEELAATSSRDHGSRTPRRGIVWAAERLASFPEYFESAELILRRLALSETELGIGNNATGIWRQLFRVYLSGTAVPFLDRFEIFKRMALSIDPGERDLALGGLDHLVDSHVSRMGSPTLVGGRIPPPDWYPQTRAEHDACLVQVMAFAEELLARPEPLAEAAWAYFNKHLRLFLAWGQLDLLEWMIERHPIPERFLGSWLEEIDNFLQYEGGDRATASQELVDYCDRVQKWGATLLPGEFGGRLRGIIGKDLWHHSIREDDWKQESEIVPLVEEVLGNRELFEANVEYLTSPEARSASTFGVLLGRKDTSGSFLDGILAASRRYRSTALLRGYVGGILQDSPDHISRISQMIDLLEQDDPEIAAEIIVAAVEVTDPVTRLSRMVGAGKLHPGYMQYLHYGRILRAALSAQVATVLKVLAPAGCAVERLKLAVELIGDRLQDLEAVRNEDADTIATMKNVLAQSATAEDNADFWWAKAVGLLGALDPQWAAAVATHAISGDDFSKRDKASGILSGLATTNPAVVMEVVGGVLLDPQQAWRWRIGSNREIFSALPVQVVMQWLSQVGIEGARRLARHLPSPVVAPDGTPTVPELTEGVLSIYGEDAEVFREFGVGRHDMEVSLGPLSSNYEGRAQGARPFLNHPLAVIRQWAEQEIASAEHFARVWRNQEEDEGFER